MFSNFNKALRTLGVRPNEEPPGFLDIPKGSPVELPEPPCTCFQCTQQWRQVSEEPVLSSIYETVLGDEQALMNVQRLVARIETNFLWLRASVLKSGDTLISRWFRAKQVGRVRYLKEAVPDISPKPFPEAWLKQNNRSWYQLRTQHANTYLLPFFNLEELSIKPDNLLHLLHSRTAHSYQSFVPMDTEWHRSEYNKIMFGLSFNAHCIVMTPGPHFGTLTLFDPEAAHEWRIVGFPRAQLTRRAQALLYERLRNVVETVLADTTRSQGKTGQWKVFIDSGCRIDPSIEPPSWYITRPFDKPPTVNAARFHAIAKAQRQYADDHLWLLQTDPMYLQSHVRTLKMGKAFGLCTEEESAHALTWSIFVLPSLLARLWHAIEAECADVRRAKVRRRGTPTPENTRTYKDLLNALELKLRYGFQHYSAKVDRLVRSTPGFENSYQYHRSENGSIEYSLSHQCESRICECQNFKKDPLQQYIRYLEEDLTKPDHFEHSVIFSCIDCHLERASGQERGRVDSHLRDYISTMASIYELYSTIRLARPSPWIPTSCLHCVDENQTRRLFWRQLTKETADTFLDKNEDAELGRKLIRISQFPIPGSTEDKSQLERTIKAHKMTRDFWNHGRRLFIEAQGISALNEADRADELGPYRFVLDGRNWAELDDLERRLEAMTVQKMSPQLPNDAKQVATPPQSVWGTETLSRQQDQPRHQSTRIKPKTRPDRASGSQSDRELVSTLHGFTNKDQVIKAISVNAKTVALFSRIYPAVGSKSPGSGKTRWTDFVISMSDAGFKAIEGSGSAVAFENPDPENGGRVVVHRPHPDPELTDFMLRTIGKRMHKWFGWRRESFRLRANG